MKKAISVTLIGAYSFILSLVFYIISAVEGYYPDDYGTSIAYGNKDCFVFCVMCFFILALGVYMIYMDYKGLENHYVIPLVVIVDSVIPALYCLAMGIKNAIKGKACVSYFCMMGLALTVLVLGVCLLLEVKKRESK